MTILLETGASTIHIIINLRTVFLHQCFHPLDLRARLSGHLPRCTSPTSRALAEVMSVPMAEVVMVMVMDVRCTTITVMVVMVMVMVMVTTATVASEIRIISSSVPPLTPCLLNVSRSPVGQPSGHPCGTAAVVYALSAPQI